MMFAVSLLPIASIVFAGRGAPGDPSRFRARDAQMRVAP
jgi:hypothetical protein